MRSCRPYSARNGSIKVSTIPKPEKIAPATKYGGKMVVCQPGITDVAKSIETMECTENTRGVAMPAKTKLTSSKRVQCFARPDQPKLRKLYTRFCQGPVTRSRMVAKSGINPMYQNTKDTEKYVEIAKTSQRSGLLKLTQRDPN